MIGAYASVEEARASWTRILLHPLNAKRRTYACIWVAPGGGCYVGGTRLDVQAYPEHRGSRRVFRFRRVRRGAPLECLDERVGDGIWVRVNETEGSHG